MKQRRLDTLPGGIPTPYLDMHLITAAVALGVSDSEQHAANLQGRIKSQESELRDGRRTIAELTAHNNSLVAQRNLLLGFLLMQRQRGQGEATEEAAPQAEDELAQRTDAEVIELPRSLHDPATTATTFQQPEAEPAAPVTSIEQLRREMLGEFPSIKGQI